MRSRLATLRRWLRTTLIAIGVLVITLPAQAHLMVAQRGTLNIVGDGGFVVMSLPVDAFSGIDDDANGRLSMDEMRRHASAIERQVLRGLTLAGPGGQRALEGLMLQLSPDDSAPAEPARHLVVLGRFALAAGDVSSSAPGQTVTPLRLGFSLFGQGAAAQRQHVTVTHGGEKQLMVFTPRQPEREVMPSVRQVLVSQVQLGAEHIVAGWDHLLFLLLVLASGWGLRQVIGALTAFTCGHAVTLTMSVLGWIAMPATIVEPAIALTIVGMAAWDLHARRAGQRLAASGRLALVFGCALIHGLGLGSALADAGIDGRFRLASLAGFNVGVELAQVAVALIAAALGLAWQRLRCAASPAKVAQAASVLAMVAGVRWFIERVATAV